MNSHSPVMRVAQKPPSTEFVLCYIRWYVSFPYNGTPFQQVAYFLSLLDFWAVVTAPGTDLTFLL